jgi:DNA modification methylase/5-methylcytosine-specific restriction endonuclease McrA
VGALNVSNRTLAIMDNLPFLRSINNESIDLIAIDPPFAANETFTQNPRPPITGAELAEEQALAAAHGVPHNEGIGETRVRDVWSWDEHIHPGWKERIEDDYPPVFKVIEAVEACATENEAAYICFMAVRLIECQRVLKDTGSIYVHCDDHANSYLRMLLDAVFGARNFRNGIAWQRNDGRGKGSQHKSKAWGQNTDTILFYAKSDCALVAPHRPLTESERLEKFPKTDVDGRPYYTGIPVFRSRAMGARPNLCYEWRGHRNPYPSGWRLSKERLEEEYQKGNIIIREDGKIERRKYLEDYEGVPVDDFWQDIPRLTGGSEKTGYATQKPLALYERIIQASSNPGDVVMDIFAGCATTAVAAERLERQWIACDMAYRSWTMLKRRFYLNGVVLQGTTDATKNALAAVKKDKGFQEPQQWTTGYVIGPKEMPRRADTDPAPYHHLPQNRRGRRTTQSATWSGRISKEGAKNLLIQRFGPVCWGCGYEPRRPNGTLDDTLLEVDHIRARKASEGTPGDDELYNLALLHRTCNGIKRNKLTLEELRSHNAWNGLLYVDSLSGLVDLFEAQQFANDQIARHVAAHGYQPSLTEPRLVAESPGD